MLGSNFLGSVGVGLGLGYYLDRERGQYRRALLRDQMAHAGHRTSRLFRAAGIDFQNRKEGVKHDVSSIFSHEDVPDYKLVERVRSKMGRFVSHPSAIDVSASNGRIILSGPILRDEVDGLLAAVYTVPGVRSVENRLEEHESADNVPGLQGQGRRTQGSETAREAWPPMYRVAAETAGGMMALYGLRRGGLFGMISGAAGVGLLVRAATNQEVKRLTGMGAGRRAVDLQKAINIHAPVDEVFRHFTRIENFPLFMHNVREVRDLGGGRSRWTIQGPAGLQFNWESEITEIVENEKLSWKSLPNSSVEHAGTVRFTSTQEGGSHIDIRMSYNPPAGVIGHTVARLLGEDAKSKLDEDLVRAKTFIETGKVPHDNAAHVGKKEAAEKLRTEKS